MAREQGASENECLILIIQNIFNKLYGASLFARDAPLFTDVAFPYLGGSLIYGHIDNIILNRGHFGPLGFQSLLELINTNSEYPSFTKEICLSWYEGLDKLPQYSPEDHEASLIAKRDLEGLFAQINRIEDWVVAHRGPRVGGEF